jgi:glyoxylase-like metal-dependent hydrolase (beta-lactamase superfamily II)
MSSTRSALRYDVFAAPEKPFRAPPPQVGDAPAWDPRTATLIFGDRDAVLVDALMTVAEATVLAQWVALHDRDLTTVYITHGHGDHYLGLPAVLGQFPAARVVAAPGTVRQMRERESDPSGGIFRTLFPGQVAESVPLPEPLESREIGLEGSVLEVIETGRTDAPDTTSLYVADLGLVVAGDVAYNHCHMFVGNTTPDGREEWLAALDRLAALKPDAVVCGHKDPSRGNPPTVLAESRGYLEYYGQLRQAAVPDEDLFTAMVDRYPDWVSRQQFLILGLG